MTASGTCILPSYRNMYYPLSVRYRNITEISYAHSDLSTHCIVNRTHVHASGMGSPSLVSVSHVLTSTVYPKKYAHSFVVLCFVVVVQSFIMNSHEVFIHIHQSCFAGTGAIVRLPQCQWSKPDGYGKISQCTTTTKHSKAKSVCIFLGIYCTSGTSGNSFAPKSHHLNNWWPGQCVAYASPCPNESTPLSTF